jgi:hypothetical protein
MKKCLDLDPGYGIKHPGSATPGNTAWHHLAIQIRIRTQIALGCNRSKSNINAKQNTRDTRIII